MTITAISEHPRNAGSINENDVAVAIRRALGRDRGVTVSPGWINVMAHSGWIESTTPPEVRQFLASQMLNGKAGEVTFDLDLRPEAAKTRADHERVLSRSVTLRVLIILGTMIAGIAIIA